MEHFINGFCLFFNPSKAQEFYFEPNEGGVGEHFHNAFGHLTEAFNVEKKKTDSAKKQK